MGQKERGEGEGGRGVECWMGDELLLKDGGRGLLDKLRVELQCYQ